MRNPVQQRSGFPGTTARVASPRRRRPLPKVKPGVRIRATLPGVEASRQPAPTSRPDSTVRDDGELLRELTVVIVHHRTPELLRRCLDRLKQYASPARLIVVDTSGKQSAERLCHRHPEVEVVAAPNHSLAAAANCGFRQATTAFLAHMNADVLIGAETFPALLRALRLPGVGMSGPLSLNPAGRPQEMGLPYRRHYLRLRLAAAVRGHGKVTATPPLVRVPWLAGCLQVIRREVLEHCGGLDASFRFYNEDLEWCLRLGRAGYRCLLVGTPVVHLGGSSTPSQAAFLVEGYRGGMIVSRRYRTGWYRWLHRRLVLLYSRRRARREGHPERRHAYALIAHMFAAGRFDESPFGESLFLPNPDLPWAMLPGPVSTDSAPADSAPADSTAPDAPGVAPP